MQWERNLLRTMKLSEFWPAAASAMVKSFTLSFQHSAPQVSSLPAKNIQIELYNEMTKSKQIIFLIKNNCEDLKNSWNCPKNIEDLVPRDAFLKSKNLVLEMSLGFYLVSKY
jgi:hypothetical protein